MVYCAYIKNVNERGDDVVEKYDLSSLRSILSVGEPLNPEVIKWSKDVYDKRVLDTWWMTETGAI